MKTKKLGMKIMQIIVWFSFFTFNGALFSQTQIDQYLIADSLILSDNLEAAEDYLIQLSKDNPHNMDYHYSLGKIFYHKGDYKRSIMHLKKAQEFGVGYHSNYFMACNYINLQKPDSALYFLSKHIISPLNDNMSYEEALYDTVFESLYDLPEYIALLPPKITDTLNVTENWRKDIDYLSRMLKKTHFDPFCSLNEEDWDDEIEKLKQDVPTLSDDQILVRLCQFVAKIGDGHTSIYTFKSNLPVLYLPILTEIFDDGCYIIGATENYKELLGAKIIAVNGLDFKNVFQKVSSVHSVDNEQGYKSIFGWNFIKMNLLHGLGISKSNESLEINYVSDGVEKTKTIYSLPKLTKLFRYHPHFKKEYPLFLKNWRRGSRKTYWYEYNKESKIFYVQINQIASRKENPLPEFCDSVKKVMESLNISAFVLDIRNNGGGNTDLNKHILKLMLSEKINHKGKLFTVIGPKTFSAAQNLTTILENYTETIFIGDRTASKPHFIGESHYLKLPYSGLMVGSSNVFHQHGHSADTRKWTAPDIRAEFNFEHFKNGIDPVMEEILKYIKNKK